jgi:hypothetical protein
MKVRRIGLVRGGGDALASEPMSVELPFALDDLVVWNAGPSPSSGHPEDVTSGSVWRLATCQRRLWVTYDAAAALTEVAGECREGRSAYEFLLRVATGLESAIAGETNVLGQLRKSWAFWSAARGECEPGVRALAPLARSLFADAALVRARHLQGIGGSSYGTLTRMLLRPQRGERVLLVGSGALSKSIAPVFAAFERATYSRTDDASLPLAGVQRFSPGQELAAVRWTDVAVFCTPAATDADGCWIEALGIAPRVRVAHLGCRRESPGAWERVAGLFTLDDLFDLQRAQGELRSGQLARAAQACREIAGTRWAKIDAPAGRLARA